MRGGVFDAPGETLRGEIASDLRVALQRHQNMRQGTGEQFRVREVVGLGHAPREKLSFKPTHYRKLVKTYDERWDAIMPCSTA